MSNQEFFIFGPVKVYFYGIFIVLGTFLGYWIATSRISKFNLPKEFPQKIIFILFPICLIGARVYHILSWITYYKIFPTEVFLLWHGGLGFYGAFIFGLFGIILVSIFYNIRVLEILDFLAPPVLLIQAIGRLGNFFNLEAFGPPTNLPWKIYIPPEKRPIIFLEQSYFHPTFFYESILCLLLFFLIFLLEKKIKHKQGFVCGLYFLGYGLARFFLEFLRIETWIIKGINVAQFFSFGLIVCGLALIIKNVKIK